MLLLDPDMMGFLQFFLMSVPTCSCKAEQSRYQQYLMYIYVCEVYPAAGSFPLYLYYIEAECSLLTIRQSAGRINVRYYLNPQYFT